jgi:hypothetical protein
MIVIIAALLAAPTFAGILLIVHGSRRRVAVASFRVPPAEETAESVRRFHAASERFANIELAWERFSHGRALLLDDMRAAASGGARRRRKAGPITRWI